MKRDVGIELYRCLLMLGIVALHTFQCAGYGFSPFCHWIEFCVDGFVFISGWYGIRFGWKKVAKLYFLALFSSAIYTLVISRLAGQGASLSSIIKAAGWYWFVNAYVMLMCIAPIVNEGLERLRSEGVCKVKTVVGPLLIAIFGWSFCCDIPCLKAWIPSAQGFGSHTFLTLLGVYVVARLARQFELDLKIKTGYLWIMLVILSLLAFLNLNKYNSPVAVLMGMTCFLLMKRFPWGAGQIPKVIGNVVLTISPCMLSVYLLHACRSDLSVVRRVLGFWSNPLLGAVLTTLIVFIGCVIVDLMRRIIIRSVRKYL